MAASVAAGVLVLLSAAMLTAGGWLWHTMGLVVTDDELDGSYPEVLPPEEGEAVYSVPPDNPLTPADYNVKEVGLIPARGDTPNVTNILLLGIDARTIKAGGRSDTTIILSINRSRKTIRLISLMRDTAVALPGRDRNGDGKDDYDKLTNAYSYGGFSLLSKTIEQNFRLKIDNYIGVNFVTFPAVVDIMGGVGLELTEAETTQVCAPDQQREVWQKDFRRIGAEAKAYHLNGYQALQYARIRRLAGSDFQRTARQRKVVAQLIVQAKAMSFIDLNRVLQLALPQTVTTLPADRLLQYAMDAGAYAGFALDTDCRLPLNKGYTNRPLLPNGSEPLWLTDPAEAVRSLHEWIYG